MRDCGDTAFEQARQRAAAVLQRRRSEALAAAPAAGRGASSGTPPCRPLPLGGMLERVRAADAVRHCSSSWVTWKHRLLEDFAAWAAAQALQTPEQVSRSAAEAYLNRLREPDSKGRPKAIRWPAT
jgi:hypothetical protein